MQSARYTLAIHKGNVFYYMYIRKFDRLQQAFGHMQRLIHQDVKRQLQQNMKLYDWIVFYCSKFLQKNMEQLLGNKLTTTIIISNSSSSSTIKSTNHKYIRIWVHVCFLMRAKKKCCRRHVSDNEIALPPVDWIECELWAMNVGWRLARIKLAWLLFIMWNWISIRDYWVINDFSAEDLDFCVFVTEIIGHHMPNDWTPYIILSVYLEMFVNNLRIWCHWFGLKISAIRLVSLVHGFTLPAFHF